MSRQSSRAESFQFAFAGFWHALKTQANFQIQIAIALLVLCLAWILDFSRGEWILLILTIGLVLTVELLNTVVEIVVDLAVKEKLITDARIAKDVSAAAVLLVSFISAAIGILLFLPHLAGFFS